MEFCLITDKPDFAQEAESAGVERIMIDLEQNGKAQRQAGRGLFISTHRIESVPLMKAALSQAALVVRVNALTDDRAEEIETVLAAQADFVMLPYFHRLAEVRQFLTLVRGRAKTILLVETKSAVAILPEILKETGVDEIHLGLNDLSISLGHQVIFESLCNGMIDRAAELLNGAGIPFGFGGLARLSNRDLPIHPEMILAEQVRLGASVGWLGRSFRGELEYHRRAGELSDEIRNLRAALERWSVSSPDALAHNRTTLCEAVHAWKAQVVGSVH